MEKILTIVIPTYNMQDYLRRCLASLIVPEEQMKQLEVLVVNDGSKDHSSVIAHEYQDKYPDTFRVIDKDNGHYGSCVNAALKIATGKYFRLVDADDWVNTSGLIKLIDLLSVHNEDAVFTKFSLQYLYKNKVKLCDVNGIEWKSYNLNKEIIPLACLAMHGISFRLELLKDIHYIQTEGIAYTDTEFVYYPLCQAKSLVCLDIELYQYFIGRGEQTMARKSIIKNYGHFKRIFDNIWEYKPISPNVSYEYLRNIYLSRTMKYMLDIQIKYSNGTLEHNEQLRGDLLLLEKCNIDAYNFLIKSKTFCFRYVKNWYNRNMLSVLQNILFKLYRLF